MGKIQEISAQRGTEVQRRAGESAMAIFNSILDRDGYRRRFEELLGTRTPQFLSALVSVVNGSDQLKQVVYSAPVTIIQAALKAASYDLPIDPGLGFAYIVPFKNKKIEEGREIYRSEAAFVLGYRGMIQLALRTGAYKRLNVVEIRQGELQKYDRLRDELELEFIEDDEARENLPIVGYAAYMQLLNGMEKTVYKTVAQIRAHEERHRKGKYTNPIWRTDFDAMARKTALRELIGKWGLMSIDYRYSSDAQAIQAAAEILADEDAGEIIEATMEPERGEPDGIQAQLEQMNQQEDGK